MRLRLYHIVLLFVSLVFLSCQKELSYEGGAPGTGTLPPANPNPPVSDKDTMYATINGQKWVAQNITGSVLSTITTQLEVTGTSPTGAPDISLLISTDLTPAGSPYAFDLAAGISGVYNPMSSTVFLSATGQLTILENNSSTHRMRGNFNFQATDPTGAIMLAQQVTLGYFSIKYN